jgi:hypothetical protein
MQWAKDDNHGCGRHEVFHQELNWRLNEVLRWLIYVKHIWSTLIYSIRSQPWSSWCNIIYSLLGCMQTLLRIELVSVLLKDKDGLISCAASVWAFISYKVMRTIYKCLFPGIQNWQTVLMLKWYMRILNHNNVFCFWIVHQRGKKNTSIFSLKTGGSSFSLLYPL